MTDQVLAETIRQARAAENALTDAFLEGRVPEHDVDIAMDSTNQLVEEAIRRGLIRKPFDAI